MNRKLEIGRISYINVDPIYYGFENGAQKNKYKIVSDNPAMLNRMLAEKKLAISAVSAAAYAANQDNWLILPNLSVSCAADVMSVIFVSEVSIKKLENQQVIISAESKTASDLIKLFFKSQNIAPNFIIKKIKTFKDVDEKAALIIGDAALSGGWDKHFKYTWDLGGLWNNITNLPFVFALWAVNKDFARTEKEAVLRLIKDFEASKREGKKNMEAIISAGAKKLNIPYLVCKQYFEKLDFDLDDKKRAGLVMFFDKLYGYELIDRAVSLNYFAG
jgi:chorismate dehydratase